MKLKFLRKRLRNISGIFALIDFLTLGSFSVLGAKVSENKFFQKISCEVKLKIATWPPV